MCGDAEACSGEEIAGLLKKRKMRMMMNNMMIRKFSRAELEAGRNGLGLCIARDELSLCVFKA